VSVQINILYLASVVVIWLLVYHITYWLSETLNDSSLVCWSVGPLGLSSVSLREPRLPRLLWQFLISGVVLGAVTYVCLFSLRPSPIMGLDQDGASRAIAATIPVIALTLIQLVGVIRARRYPLWGEARVMAQVQRSQATGATIVFTALGRAFLRDRFGATPGEFTRMVRY
jgi:drug/metabolite transporter (DMT)-like permease